MPSHENSLFDLETRLAGTLKRVRPPSDVTQRLRDRIRLPEPHLLAQRLSDWRFYFLTVGGVVSGLLIVITVARALFHLTSRKGG